MSAFEPNIRPDCTDALTATLGQRIMVIDGAMGTAIQRDRPDEAGYRGERFKDWPSDLVGNNDLLSLTQPQIIEGIHREYLQAGADILETNTFNANAVSLSDYDMAELAYELNYAGAALARRPPTSSAPGEARYVAGALGRRRGPHRSRQTSTTRSPQRLLRPTGRRLPGSRQRPGRRRRRHNHHRDHLRLLNAKAAVFAVETLFEDRGRRWPVIISGTITDASGERCPVR
ncbi:homocysteine S-methyltransferase family protein [Mycobacterium ulcerans str. Harvey]|uniref:Homocysteine S-methyltransferase family protein n=1 Tax=Mycobacterium ulcerans str. Harvey TaxID=1299332 RepID=A0ABN0QQ48_MYCUL|nr:homocysteine S-methyltransferase family protein [Mycobacterium ulcerans str. Harvey]